MNTFPVDAGAAIKACSQTELQTVDADLQAPGCRDSLGALSDARGDGPLSRWSWAVLEELWRGVTGGWAASEKKKRRWQCQVNDWP